MTQAGLELTVSGWLLPYSDATVSASQVHNYKRASNSQVKDSLSGKNDYSQCMDNL